jgi:hypothetical protein
MKKKVINKRLFCGSKNGIRGALTKYQNIKEYKEKINEKFKK